MERIDPSGKAVLEASPFRVSLLVLVAVGGVASACGSGSTDSGGSKGAATGAEQGSGGGTGASGGSSGASGLTGNGAPGGCTMQVQTGSHTECDWALCGDSDPSVCCSDVPNYGTLQGTLCGGTCTDLSSDDAHCGACDTPCSGNTSCSKGVCVDAPAAGGASGISGGGGGASGSLPPAGGGTAGSLPPASGGASGSSGGHASAGGTSGGSAGSATGGSVGYVANPCAGTTGWGLTCGASLVGGNPAIIYFCNEGTTYASGACPSGCHASPQGVPDYCVGSDPCVTAIFDGQWCGSSLSAADANSLYTCQNRVTVTKASCSPCTASPPGQADVCVPLEMGGF